MFFLHLSYGYAGTLNDLTILNFSPLLERLIDGYYDSVEKRSGAVPYKIGNQVFDRTFVLVNGIYLPYSRFVKGMKQPITEEEKQYTSWQEGARKDIERASGILKGCWQFMARPILLLNLADVGRRVQTCLILHNILVCDRVMDSIGDIYDPAYSYQDFSPVIQQPIDLEEVQQRSIGCQSEEAHVEGRSGTRVLEIVEHSDEHPASVIALVTNKDRWRCLKDSKEHERLFIALKERFGN